MKFALLSLAIMPLIANAHVHDDWMTVHRVDVRTHEAIHTASTNSVNRLAVLTIDCDKAITLYETRAYLTAAKPDEIWYSLDGNPYVRVESNQLQQQSSVTTYLGNSDDVIDTLKTGNMLEYVVNNGHGVSYSYHFSLHGMNDAYDALGELCKW
ncbi:hypothetical protein phiGrn1_0271 [Vibrio phage phi-Grn1]|uniref:Uncharacterized protein n=1 Tax=Vibrio phage phi-Grn1 TaxID=1747713 RepID=A0A126HGY1_9CAUD|nr:hypothetical protein phiGrn1_0271 [Vibrio phage phi-Grn1]